MTSIAALGVGAFALRQGMAVGDYEILAVLGHGGFGITYRARERRTGQEVAIKEYLPVSLAVRQAGSLVLPRSTEIAEDFIWGRDRFVAESRTLATLNDAPAIVRTRDFIEANGTAYIVMELLRGQTLEQRLKTSGILSPAEMETLIWPLLDGLQKVHGAGFLHRDVKPANIILDDEGRPTLIDFGAARAAVASRSMTLTAIFTPGFGAPEQFTSGNQGPWTDVYGLAATLYNAVTGTAPPSSFDRMLDDSYQPLQLRKAHGLTVGMAAGIDLGLQVRAADRPQSIEAWRGILSGTVAPPPAATVVMRQASPSPAALRSWPRRFVLAGAGLAALLVISGGVYFLNDRLRPPVALEDMKAEDLERALAARRAADAEAARKRQAEDEARQKAAADAAAKRAADEALAKAQAERIKAEQELARLREQQEAEETQRKAEAEIAARRQEEENARRKAEAEAEAKRRADEALVRAQAEREQAEAEAKARAEAEAKARAEAAEKARAEAEARARAEAQAKEKADAEAAENTLRLGAEDRKRLQIALTSLGFDTRGNDGQFGPRTREMVAAWQTSRRQAATGFLDGTQRQALLREAAAALSKYDVEQKRIEDEKKAAEDKRKAEEEKKKADEEKKRATAAAASQPAAAPQVPASSTFAGAFMIYAQIGAESVAEWTVSQTGSSLKGSLSMRHCGSTPVNLSVSPAGQVSGTLESFTGARHCSKIPFTVTGRIVGDALQLDMEGVGSKGSGTLKRQGN